MSKWLNSFPRWKVYNKSEYYTNPAANCIKRFYTLDEAREFVNTLDFECEIVFD